MEKVDIYDKYKTNFHKTIKMVFSAFELSAQANITSTSSHFKT